MSDSPKQARTKNEGPTSRKLCSEFVPSPSSPPFPSPSHPSSYAPTKAHSERKRGASQRPHSRCWMRQEPHCKPMTLQLTLTLAASLSLVFCGSHVSHPATQQAYLSIAAGDTAEHITGCNFPNKQRIPTVARQLKLYSFNSAVASYPSPLQTKRNGSILRITTGSL